MKKILFPFLLILSLGAIAQGPGSFSTLSASKSFRLQHGQVVTLIDTDTSLAANSNSRLVTQHAVKAYVDNLSAHFVIATGNTYVVPDQTTMLALSAAVGDVAVRTDSTKSFILQSLPASTLSNWVQLLFPASVPTVFGRTGNITAQYGDYDYSQLTGTPDIPVQFNPIAGANMLITGIYPNKTFTSLGGNDSLAIRSVAESDDSTTLYFLDLKGDTVATAEYTGGGSGGGGSGGGSETFQQTLINGSTLTQDNTVENGTNRFKIDVGGNPYLIINGGRKNSSFGITDSSSNFYGVEATSSSAFLGADGGNNTYTLIDDLGGRVSSQAGNSTFSVAGDGTLYFNYNDPWFIVDGQNRRFQIGDYTSDWYGTYIDINDDKASRSIKLQATNGVVLGGYGSGTHTGTATKSLQVDASGNVIEGSVSSGTPSLQQVTDVDFSTTNPLYTYNPSNSAQAELEIGTSGGVLDLINNAGATGTIDASLLTSARNYQIPNNSGILALQGLTPQITSGTSAPSSTPVKVGDIYVDTSAKKLYFAAGTSSSSDWIIAN